MCMCMLVVEKQIIVVEEERSKDFTDELKREGGEGGGDGKSLRQEETNEKRKGNGIF